MKKKLEAELISIAHRILKLKNKSEVDQLYLETRKLYEVLTVLKFHGDHYEELKTTYPAEEFEQKLETELENPLEQPATIAPIVPVVETTPPVVEEEPVPELETEPEPTAEIESEEPAEPVIVGEIVLDEEDDDDEPVAETEETPELDFAPIFELAAEVPAEEPQTIKEAHKQITLDEILSDTFEEPVFVKPGEENVQPKSEKSVEPAEVTAEKQDVLTVTLNDKFSKTINIGLNERIGFVKHLFGESNEDFNRVLSQLNSFTSFAEAKDFIEEIIKPDYNNWKGKKDYADRFMEFVEKKFL